MLINSVGTAESRSLEKVIVRPQGDPVIHALQSALRPEGHYLLAVSGGLDSMVLLHGASELVREFSLRLEVAHVDHGLRDESSLDAAHVAAVCRGLRFPFHLHTAAAPAGDRGVEAWGREVRYAFFSRLLDQFGFEAVLTAHHAGDRAETVLMRFLANREPSSIHAVDELRRLSRPFLSLNRGELEQYARRHQIRHREDSSNEDTSYLRNRYRQAILPYLARELETDIVRVLADRAESLEDDSTALEQVARQALEPLAVLTAGERDWFRCLRQLLLNQPRAVAWRMVERVLAQQFGGFIGRRTSLRVLQFFEGQEGAVEIPGGHRIRRTGGGLEFTTTEKNCTF